jgi:hypothetical protein
MTDEPGARRPIPDRPLLRAAWLLDGEPRDGPLMSMLREEWRAADG